PPEGTEVKLTSQAEVDEFVAQYKDCTSLEGSLIIGATYANDAASDITDISGLSVLSSVGESLTVGNNPKLASLHGLRGLQSIGIKLNVFGNDALNSLRGLDNITSIGENVMIYNNSQLTACAVESVCNRFAMSGVTNIFFENGEGCDVESIKTNCANCPIGDVVLRTQAEVDQFGRDFPNCTAIFGNLTIGLERLSEGNPRINGSGIENLDALSGLTTVVDSLKVWGNNELTALTGLDSLISVGGQLSIRFNSPNLKSLAGLENIGFIGDGLVVEGNLGLRALNMDKLTSIGGQLSVYIWGGFGDSNNYSSLNGLRNLTSTEGSVIIGNSEGLNSLNELSKLTSIGGDFSLQHLTSLTDLNGLNNLKSVGGELWLECNPSLTDLDALDNLRSVQGDFRLTDNGVTTLGGFEGLTRIGGSLYIKGTYNGAQPNCGDGLVSFTGLNNLTSISGGLEFNLMTLNTLSGLTKLRSIGGDLLISNTALTNLAAFANLETLGGSIRFTANEALTQLGSFAKITTVPGDIEIVSNPALRELKGFERLESTGRDLIIKGNAALADVSGLRALRIVSRDFIVSQNQRLGSLDGLEGLNTINRKLAIKNNSALTNLDALSGLDVSTMGALEISGNKELSSCTTKIICDYLDRENRIAQIQDNGARCNSVEDVAEHCGCPQYDVLLTTQKEVDEFTKLYPNCEKIIANVEIGVSSLSDPPSDIVNISGLGSIKSIEGDLVIFRNKDLSSLQGLDRLETVGGLLNIEQNPDLGSMKGLNSLASIGGVLDIRNNFALSSLQGLENLSSIGGKLEIKENKSLTSISGLEKLDASSIIALEIRGNSQLSQCTIVSVCDFLQIPDKSVVADRNGEDCETIQDVKLSCDACPT
ncbi:MAG: hypothetical protein AAFN81_32180, partial [Bacteroidota bacterium]